MRPVRRHRLPEDPEGQGDTGWFFRLNSFEQQETRRQVRFKRVHWPGLPDGEWSGRAGYAYPHILPAGYDTENLYPATRKAALKYLRDNDVVIHREAANLRSSQVCCLNFLFPFCIDIENAARALGALLPGAAVVDRIEFEYTGPDDDSATAWLGEPPGGQRGQNRTSSDAAIWWQDGAGLRRLTLVEWKYTERQFGSCGGFASRANAQKAKCLGWQPEHFEPSRDCYLERRDTDRNCRRYWEHLADAGIALTGYRSKACPFIGPLYQLMRLHLLAAYLKTHGDTETVDVTAVHFRGNTSLEIPPADLSHLGPDLTSAWLRLLSRPGDFRVCAAEDIAATIRSGGPEPILSRYLAERYGV